MPFVTVGLSAWQAHRRFQAYPRLSRTVVSVCATKISLCWGDEMHVGLGGYSPEDVDDPFEIIGAVLDRPFLAGPIDKHRREDLQVLSVLEALSGVGMLRHPIEVRVGEDPPDRYLRHGSREWGTELTELTVQDVRQDLAPVRQFGRELHQRLEARATEFAHLRGRMVTLAKLTDSPLPKDHGQLLADVEAALLVDKGFVGEDLDLSHGLPQQLGARGLYGDLGPFNLVVNPAPPGGSPLALTVSASSQSQIRLSEAVASLAARIAAKDKTGNEILIVTCGLVDAYGYTCPADQAIFRLLSQALADSKSVLPVKPAHIRGVLIHLWNTPYVRHWERDHDVPWVIALPED